MEIIKLDHQHYIRMTDIMKGMELNDQHCKGCVEQYTFRCKPLEISTIENIKWISCKSACHFIEWYLDNSYNVVPSVNQFKHELKKFAKKIPKRLPGILSKMERFFRSFLQREKPRI